MSKYLGDDESVRVVKHNHRFRVVVFGRNSLGGETIKEVVSSHSNENAAKDALRMFVRAKT